MEKDNVLVPREERRINPPRRDADRIMVLEIHQMYAAGQMKDLVTEMSQAKMGSEERGAALLSHVDTMWGEIRQAMMTLQNRVAEIDNRSKTIQQYQQRRMAREWTLVLGVVLAFATAVITVFVGK